MPDATVKKCEILSIQAERAMLKRPVFQLLIIFVLTIILFDIIAYFLVPPSYTGFAEEYRDIELLPTLSTQASEPVYLALSRPYPRYYFEADETLGFDIRRGATATAKFREGEYPIFANDLGCFDKNTLHDFQQSDEYVYFAGDSFTWGYTRYEKKFATAWEQRTKKVTAKCGVTHTGQLHQFEKFKRITSRIGKFPKIVFVGFCSNDPANDLAHPHTTVISGYPVDTAFLKDHSIVRPSMEDVKNRVDASIRWEFSQRPSMWIRLKTAVKVYSLSANILNGVTRYLTPGAQPGSGSQLARTQLNEKPGQNFGDTLYNAFTDDDTKNHYTSDPRANLNKLAIKNWSRHARASGYKLVFLLFPPSEYFNDVDYFRQVKGWLDSCGVDYVDFALIFRKGGYELYDLYWRKDGHLNENGNQVVGQELSRIFM
jgi:hypothetical protein